MSARLAPSDLRRPISRVRSVTLISMMFMITMPPTTMPIADHGGDRGEEEPGELAPERDQRVGLVHGEVVLLAGPQPMGDPHRLLGADHGAARSPRRSPS